MLRRLDLRRALDFVAAAHACDDLDDLAHHVANRLPTLIRCDVASYNEINPRLRRIRWVVTDGTASFPDAERVFGSYMHEHPSVRHPERLHQAVRIRDFLSPRQWHRTGMYNEFYRRLHLEHVLGINLPTESGFIGVSPLRAAGEFGQRERELITLLRPHLVQAYRAAELRTEMSAHLALFARGVEVSGLGVILLRTDDRVARLNRCARAWVAQQFHADLGEGSPLPPALQSWLREIRADGELIGMPSTSFERDGQRLRACLLTERGERMIVLRTSRTSPTPQDLAPLHLARRESEVLLWLAMGKTDSEIAQILGVSPRTVSHTLERVYRKLGVETRLAAALRALQTDDWAVRCT